MGGLCGAVASRAGCPAGIPPSPLKKVPQGKTEPLPSEPDSQPRLSLSTPEGKAHLDALMHAYDELACRDPHKDPTSLFYQMWLHALNCARNQRNVHGNWAFLPWHRGFLYFHERILRKILGDSFRLPVWDWDNDERVPAAYGSWAKARLSAHAHEDLAGMVNACSIQAWLFSGDYEGFAGYPPNFISGGHSPAGLAPAGLAPAGLHSLAHGRIAGTFGPPKTAAADPIFYAHHANVDRFWIHWRNSHPDFKVPDGFGDQVFCFYDEDGQQRFVRSGDLLDEKRLGYYYPKPPAAPVLNTANLLLGREIPNAGEAAEFFRDAMRKIGIAAGNPLLALRELEHEVRDAAGAAANWKLPFNIRWNPVNVMPGCYYLIAIQPAVGPMKPVAGFGVFGMHSRAPLVATGCFPLSDVLLFLAPGSRLVYGMADGNGTAIEDPRPVWPAFLNLLRT